MNKVTEEELEDLSKTEILYFALFCAKSVQHLTILPEAKVCIETLELYLVGKATSEDCKIAGYAAAYAADAADAADAAGYAAGAAAYAAYAAYAGYAAAYAAYAGAGAAYAAYANKTKIITEQRKYLEELKNCENILLGKEL